MQQRVGCQQALEPGKGARHGSDCREEQAEWQGREDRPLSIATTRKPTAAQGKSQVLCARVGHELAPTFSLCARVAYNPLVNTTLDTNDPFWRTVLERRSIRRYTDQPVPRVLLERLLTAAIWAPNAHNRQPWRFAVVIGEKAKHRLAQAMAERWQGDLQAEGVAPEEATHRTRNSYRRITGAGALVVGCLTMAEMDWHADPQRRHLEWVMAVQSTALALGNLLLAAHREGLAACWMCAPLFAPDVVRQVLSLPADWQPQALITLGYPAETRTKTRRPWQEVTVWR
ncbi:MAG: hypothetical protein D6775_14415 [Caldilineae bacterium]|nr:MAG: hypothetical protein D6775_14415 [Caldilineae bacterium]